MVTRDVPPKPSFFRMGTRFLIPLFALNLVVLSAHDDKKDKKEEKKAEPAHREAPAKAEPRREAPPARQEGRRDNPEPRPEVRRDTPQPRPEMRRETPETPRPEMRRDLPQPRPEVRRETPEAPRPDLSRQAPVVPPRVEPRTPAPTRIEPLRPAPPAPRAEPPRTAPEFHREATPMRPGMTEHRGPERQVVRTPGGGEIQRTPTGSIREVRTPNGAVIRHSPSGVRQVEINRPGGRIIVANGSGRSGYVQRPLVVHGQTFVQRTYVINGVSRAHIYRPWAYGGREYHIYTPVHYYHPAFYHWAYTPWARPVSYRWGWAGRPWYGYYGGYFRPYPTYVSPCYWLADFLIAATLESAFVAQNATYVSAPVEYDDRSAMSPEVKQAIADEVRRQMDQAQADQAQGGRVSGPPALFSSNGPRVFLVSGQVMAYSGNQECPLVDGDVLGLVQTPAPGAEWADVRIMSTRGTSCPRGAIVSVRTMDLQEMQNHMQATIDQGMDKLQASQGADGMPPLPSGAAGRLDTDYTSVINPDDNALDELSLAVKEANGSEQTLINQGGQDATPSSTTISLGMTPGQVVNILGQPRNTVDLGAKKIYVYKDLKVTFLNGRVSDVQ